MNEYNHRIEKILNNLDVIIDKLDLLINLMTNGR
jgi:hypothetical protein